MIRIVEVVTFRPDLDKLLHNFFSWYITKHDVLGVLWHNSKTVRNSSLVVSLFLLQLLFK